MFNFRRKAKSEKKDAAETPAGQTPPSVEGEAAPSEAGAVPAADTSTASATADAGKDSKKNKLKKKRRKFLARYRRTKKGGFKFRKDPAFVLFVGDEGAILLYIKDKQVQSREFVSSPEGNEISAFNARFAEDTNAPILMVVDTMDQNYVQQSLPPVTSLSVGKLIKRRLDRDFPNDEIKGALALGREKGGRKDWNFMMIALERTENINRWLDYFDTLPNWLSGIYLVPVESEILVRQMEHSLHPDRVQRSQWQFLISYNKVSGFRQVILRNHRLIFTRVGQPVGELTPEVIAGNIEQEALNTIEYMKRMGLHPADGLDVYVIASAAINKAIEAARFKASHVDILTPHEVATKLHLEGATQEGDEYGDVILAAVLGGSRRHVLKFITESARKLDLLFRFKVGQRIAISIFTGVLISYVGTTLYDIKSIIDNVDNLHTVKNQHVRQLEALKADIAKAPEDIDKITDLVELNEILKDRALSPVPMMRRIARSMGKGVRIKSLSWEEVGTEKGAPAKANAANKNKKEEEPAAMARVKLTVEFLDNTDEQQKFVRHANAWLEEFGEKVLATEINYTVLPGAVSESENFEIALGKAASSASNRFDGGVVETQLQFYAPIFDPPPPEEPPAEETATPEQQGTTSPKAGGQ